mmetsp:Transcript_49499/g.87147  ORF Transcript_49499/g.87147 Transcript_49499/m.87147 type:complete len:87 (+) Transcript_49499:611-871(+)
MPLVRGCLAPSFEGAAQALDSSTLSDDAAGGRKQALIPAKAEPSMQGLAPLLVSNLLSNSLSSGGTMVVVHYDASPQKKRVTLQTM